ARARFRQMGHQRPFRGLDPYLSGHVGQRGYAADRQARAHHHRRYAARPHDHSRCSRGGRAPACILAPRPSRGGSLRGGGPRVPREAAGGLPRAGRARSRALRLDRRLRRSGSGRQRGLGRRQSAAGSSRSAGASRGRRIVSEADAPEPPHPRETTAWFGHAEAERALLEAFRGGRIPHGWLIGGPSGIGKATLAYRMARFVLANPDPAARAVQAARSLAVPSDHPAARRVAAQSHTDLLVLERTPGPTGALRTVITVDKVRRTVRFCGATAGGGGWRICVGATADGLQAPQAANALLKVLEEPPARALFLIASHAPGRLLATIRSRCRRLMLRPLDEEDV